MGKRAYEHKTEEEKTRPVRLRIIIHRSDEWPGWEENQHRLLLSSTLSNLTCGWRRAIFPRFPDSDRATLKCIKNTTDDERIHINCPPPHTFFYVLIIWVSYSGSYTMGGIWWWVMTGRCSHPLVITLLGANTHRLALRPHRWFFDERQIWPQTAFVDHDTNHGHWRTGFKADSCLKTTQPCMFNDHSVYQLSS